MSIWASFIVTILPIIAAAAAAGAAATEPSPSPQRIVVTLEQYNACDIALPGNSCAAVAKCYGRRLVLNVEACNVVATFPNTTPPPGSSEPGTPTPLIDPVQAAMEDWVRSNVVADFVRAEEDSSLSSAWSAKAGSSSGRGSISSSTSRRGASDADLPPVPWNLEMIGLPALWDTLGTYGEGRTVAVLDSGIAESALPAFAGRISSGYDFISDADLAKDGDGGRDGNYYDPGDGDATACSSAENSWHGTKVASVLAANYSGFLGVAPRARVLPVRVLGRCSVGFASDAADAIVWAAGGQINGLEYVQQPASVLVMAFAGLGSCPSFMQTAVDLAISKGAALYAAAGNDPELYAGDHFPANCLGVVSVGALDSNMQVASYSSKLPDVFMPGGDGAQPIPCLGAALEVEGCQGTSMAVPHAAGRYTLTGTEDPRSNNGSTSLMQTDTVSAAQVAHPIFTESVGVDVAVLTLWPLNWHTALLKVPGAGGYSGCKLQFVSGSPINAATVSGCIYDGTCTVIQSTSSTGSFTWTWEAPAYSEIRIVIWTAQDASFYLSWTAIPSTQPDPVSSAIVRAYPPAGLTDYVCTLSGLAYGNGQYKLTYGSRDARGGSRELRYLMDGSLAGNYGWGCEMCYSASRCTYNGIATPLVSGYLGDWIALEMPQKISYTYVKLYQAGVLDFRVYGRNSDNLTAGWTLLQEVVGAVYDASGVHKSATITVGQSYDTIALAAGRAYSENKQFYAKEVTFYGQSFPVACPPGSAGPGDGVCSICAEGTYSKEGSTLTCTSCPAGSYSPVPNATSCLQCPAGKFSTATGATSSAVCTDCPRGSYSNAFGSSSCTPCAKGSYSDLLGAMTNTTCVACPAGTFSSAAGSSTCTTCTKGSFNSAAGSTACATCPAGMATTA